MLGFEFWKFWSFDLILMNASLVFFLEGVPISFDWILMNGKTANYPYLMGIFSFQFFLSCLWVICTHHDHLIAYRMFLGMPIVCPCNCSVRLWLLLYDCPATLMVKGNGCSGFEFQKCVCSITADMTCIFFHLNLLKPEYVTK